MRAKLTMRALASNDSLAYNKVVIHLAESEGL